MASSTDRKWNIALTELFMEDFIKRELNGGMNMYINI